MNDKKTRNHIGNEGVSKNRYELYQLAFKQFDKAIEAGFYLEAVTIIESIIADRMESRIGQLTEEPFIFGTLGSNRKILNGLGDFPKIEFVPELERLYNKIVSNWVG
ncbi:MAG: hypothetical protein ACJAWV_001955 [Flammeovirgaceae bacterium]|jgi:hypothetical protein